MSTMAIERAASSLPTSNSHTTSNTVKLMVAFRAGRKGQKALVPPRVRGPVRPGRVPRVAKLMALAIKFDEMIRRGEVRDYAQLARLGQITRARATQIMALITSSAECRFLPMALILLIQLGV